MIVSNKIQFSGVRVGQTLCRYADGGRSLQVLGVVTELTSNNRGQRVAVFDRLFSINGTDKSNRITEKTCNHASIRRLIAE